ncbi:hypothetical protein G6F70_000352 [Rhizopus microsporus]|nr:hypothetical protein G6F71_004129 [Rhizopus microsporus]KAG1204614.1 hypothetical protein G6F70_000352 [Rhizopus microsporus]KAG1212018.1 hypothetical protein G6F69_004080 [Rhizopus microsporus]KAG1235078.1 hypothetical protein G6F67_003042 [Rhizopus microsporus]KAG1264477.1 hypothetical protein G6F68_004309 [Rhizopus microsporus]
MAKPTVMFQVVQEKDTKLDTRGVLFETDFYLEKDRKNIQMKEGLLFIAASKWAQQYQQDNSSSDNALCAKCIPKIHIDLEKLLATSPYGSLLLQREYIPLTDEMCELMNRDWRHNTQSFGNHKDGVHTASLPPPIKAIHPDVWPVSLPRNDGPKLVIGTQVSNALVTSSIRLDQKLLPSVGDITTNFNLTATGSFASKIFVDVESATAAKTIISNSSTTCVSNTGMFSHQLRQIRTRFDLPSIYTLVRASDRGRIPYTTLFDTIGNEILKNGTKANPIKSIVSSCNENATGKVKEVLGNILTLYDHDDNLLILFNIVLDKKLEILAKLLMPSIVSWNASVAPHIKSVFEYLD